ncbi:TRAM superfamily RNA-binding protein [Candidatus Mancarchaeum acidiphilum]|uniref:TRAM superfamily RNA-binding protein n=1 Tax=Candidatus Mancarchaeum acidiphilum TaxID=1920749 RepID=A0A218NM76_9ARCH|nr:TRAM domain-containing protein [Candidatus Mancarchaeum acidiphilum]ASI13566.1 TRAM superfamily RNA-binding protein [Candidatus Mancarchaeum acidiphilum]
MKYLKDRVEEGMELDLKVNAKDPRGEGIGRVGDYVIFIKNAKTRVGASYKVKVVKVNRTFGYAQLVDNDKQFFGNGSLLEL